MLATASFDASTAVWAERGGDWECVAVVEGHENEVKSCAWSPSGALLATCGRDKTVWIWEVQPGFDFECVAVMHGHAQDVKQVRWHPTEDVLVSVSYDDEIRVWEEEPGGDDWSCARVVSAKDGGHTSTVWSAAFEALTGVTGDRSDGPRMATCSDDRNIVVWAAKGAPRERWTARSASFLVFLVFFLRDSRRGARNPGAGQTVESGALQMRPGQHNCQRDRIAGLAAPAGKIATDASLTCGRLGSSPATSSRSRVRFSFFFGDILRVALSPFLFFLANRPETAGAPGLALAATATFACGHDRPVLALSWGPAGLLAAGGGDNSVRCYGAGGGSAWREVGAAARAHADDVNCVAWHPTKPSLLASCADDGSVKIWNVAAVRDEAE